MSASRATLAQSRMALSWGTHHRRSPGWCRWSRPHPDLDCVGPGLDQIRVPSAVATLPAMSSIWGKIAFGVGHRRQHPVGVAVGRIMTMTSTPALSRALTRSSWSGPTPMAARPQAADTRPCRTRIFANLFDINALMVIRRAVRRCHPPPAVSRCGIYGAGPWIPPGDDHLGGDQAFPGHHLPDLLVQVGFEAQVPVGDDAHQLASVHHRNPGDAVPLHQLQHVGDTRLGADGHGSMIIPDSDFFHLFDFQGLGRRGHITVQDAEAPLAGMEMAVSASVTVSMAELSSGTLRLMRRVSRVLSHFAGQDRGGPGHQQQIIEGEGVFDVSCGIKSP